MVGFQKLATVFGKQNETKQKKPLLISSDFYSPSLSMNKMSFEPHWKVREAKETASWSCENKLLPILRILRLAKTTHWPTPFPESFKILRILLSSEISFAYFKALNLQKDRSGSLSISVHSSRQWMITGFSESSGCRTSDSLFGIVAHLDCLPNFLLRRGQKTKSSNPAKRDIENV